MMMVQRQRGILCSQITREIDNAIYIHTKDFCITRRCVAVANRITTRCRIIILGNCININGQSLYKL